MGSTWRRSASRRSRPVTPRCASGRRSTRRRSGTRRRSVDGEETGQEGNPVRLPLLRPDASEGPRHGRVDGRPPRVRPWGREEPPQGAHERPCEHLEKVMNVFEKYDPLGGPYRWVFWAVAAAW